MATEAAPARHLRLIKGGEPANPALVEVANRRTVRMLLIATGFLVFSGLLMVLSSSAISAYAQTGSGFVFFLRQFVAAFIGLGALLLTSRMRYGVWERLAFPFLAFTVLLLGLVLHPVTGHSVAGSSRWIQLGPVTIQPSEFAKLAAALYAAKFLARRRDRLEEPTEYLPMLIVMGGLGLLVMLQPDLGTTLIIVGTLFLMLFVAGARLRHVGILGLVGLVAGAGLIWSADYRRERFLGFLDPWGDPGKNGWQLIQGLIAFGSGGITGVGLGASRQKWLYVPNAHTDFIFAIIGEELGLVGTLTMLAAFVLLIAAGIRIAARAPDAFGRILAAGIVSWFGIQTLVNLGAVTGVLPITGVPLPFLSYGGNALIVSLAAVGILVNIARSATVRSTRVPGRGGRTA